MKPTVIVAPTYFGNIYYYSVLANYGRVLMDVHEHFVKQSYRTRCTIYGANGKLNLILPLEKRTKRTPVKEIKISYEENWRKVHWKSLESAYRSSPYFEFYEDDIAPFFEKKYDFLLDMNLDIQATLLDLLGIEPAIVQTESYEKEHPDADDFRDKIHPKTEAFTHDEYLQVFQEKYGFIGNLSVVDLLFNLGPEAGSFLKGNFEY